MPTHIILLLFKKAIHSLPSRIFRSQSGMALLYVLGALLVTTFLGAALMRMSSNDRLAATDYSGMASAAISARSGMQAAVAKFENDPNGSVTLLNSYLANVSNDALLGTSASPIVLDNQQQYYVKIAGFDKTNFIIQLKGTGLGKGGSRKDVVGLYALNGIAFAPAVDPVATHALYLGTAANNFFTCPTTINGDVYVSTPVQFYANASNSVFNGSFRTNVHTTDRIRMQGNYRFNQDSYFGANVWTDATGTFTFMQDVGFEYGIDAGGATNTYDFHGTAFYKNTSVANGWTLTLHGTGANTLRKTSTVTVGGGGSYGTAVNLTITNTAPASIISNLAVNTNTGDVLFDKTPISSVGKIKNWSTYRVNGYNPGGVTTALDARKLNEMYSYANTNGHLWNEYLVINLDVNIYSTRGFSTADFTGKVIFIIPNTININAGSFYNSSSSAVTIISIESGGQLNTFGGWGSTSRFRGYIHCATGGTVTYSASGVSLGTFIGAIHHQNGSTATVWGAATSTLALTFEGSFLEELATESIVYHPGGPVINPTNTLELTSANISSTLLGMCF